jgi:hypothetical protein
MADNIRLIQLNNYIRPKVEENKSKNWVLNGKNNDFYHYLINRYNGSPTNSAIINSFIDMIYGKGITATNAQTNIKDFVRFRTILKDSDLRKIISDFVIFNEFSFQVIKSKDKKSLGSIKHLPKERVAPSIENEEEEIETYFYSRNWNDLRKFPAMEFSAFGFSNDEIEIYNGKPYKAGKTYFADPDYLAGLAYMEMEEEIANYYVSHISNGLSFGYIINIPDGNSLTDEEKDDLERKIKSKLTGSSNAGKFVLSFNGREADITITTLQVADAHKQWEYLTNESRQQIMTAHRVVSPMLFGIKDNTGFGNNAEELDVAREQLIKFVIEPKQRFIIEALQEVLENYGINLDLYFRSQQEPKEIVTEMSSQICCSDEKKNTDLDYFISLGEDEDLDTYDLLECKQVNYDEEEESYLSLATETGVAKPSQKSIFDTDFTIVRYRYAGNENPEREFCKRMMAAGKIYRREDIDLMGEKNVNPGFGMHPNPNKPYSIWKHKGGGLLSAKFTGGTCKHYWEKLTYKRKDIKIDPKSPIAIEEANKNRASGTAGIAPHDI